MDNLEHFKFKHPFTCLIAGPTSSGKTFFVKKLLENGNYLIKNLNTPLKVLWCYGIWQSGYDNKCNVDITYYKGLPNNISGFNIIIIDDLMVDLGSSPDLLNLFTRQSHHSNISVVFITQNLFYKGKYIRDISLNCHYIIIMKNPRDKSQISALGRQIYPNKHKFFMESYEDATSIPYGYIKIDLTTTTPDNLRLQTNIFPNNNYFTPVVYHHVK